MVLTTICAQKTKIIQSLEIITQMISTMWKLHLLDALRTVWIRHILASIYL
jgi:hypothetical protein